MQAQAIEARIVLTVLAFVLAVGVAIPLTTKAADGPDEFAECWTGSYVNYLECIEANVGISGAREIAAVARPAIVRDTVTDYTFMEQNSWGADFDPTRLTMSSYYPSPDYASIIHNGIPSY